MRRKDCAVEVNTTLLVIFAMLAFVLTDKFVGDRVVAGTTPLYTMLFRFNIHRLKGRWY